VVSCSLCLLHRNFAMYPVFFVWSTAYLIICKNIPWHWSQLRIGSVPVQSDILPRITRYLLCRSSSCGSVQSESQTVLSVCTLHITLLSSIYISIHLPIYLSTHLSLCIYLSIYLSVSISIYLSIHPSIYLFSCLCLSVYLSIHPSIHPPLTHPPLHPSIYPSIYLWLYSPLLGLGSF
jgi:hypothetical protein